MNEFGVMELVAEGDDALECQESPLNSSGGEAASSSQAKEEAASSSQGKGEEPQSPPLPPADDQQDESNADEMRCCPNCGTHGTASELFVEGRFCSKDCQEFYRKRSGPGYHVVDLSTVTFSGNTACKQRIASCLKKMRNVRRKSGI